MGKAIGLLVGLSLVLTTALMKLSAQEESKENAELLELVKKQKEKINVLTERLHEVVEEQEKILEELKKNKKWLR
ncbi:MAG: hypothetical protein A3G87_05085 [Omnitrophica bacterium RIFCSPLOWO2_12_FULL_50_11]|nr:MAG: hypothetical protein A3G87_05085 [Omnitrophica bacterium RIFCSPLOWO2_12_FULL_50_11]